MGGRGGAGETGDPNQAKTTPKPSCQLSFRASDNTFEYKAVLGAAGIDKNGSKGKLLLHRKYSQDKKLGICLRYETICGTAGM